ncbi:MAG TPA: barstar family protein [Dongiaceae bacterium]|nr:barstar family protein [Dongiaceae bacterium]
METTRQEYLFRLEVPWIYVGAGEPERKRWIPSGFYDRAGLNVCTRQLRGSKMRTTQSLMDEFGAALQLFDGFGENWDALRECLAYMDEWLPADAYILLVEHADRVLAEASDDELATLLRVLRDTGDWWSKAVTDNDRFNRPPRPFHCLFLSSQSEGLKRIVDVAARQSIPVRTDQP